MRDASRILLFEIITRCAEDGPCAAAEQHAVVWQRHMEYGSDDSSRDRKDT